MPLRLLGPLPPQDLPPEAGGEQHLLNINCKDLQQDQGESIKAKKGLLREVGRRKGSWKSQESESSGEGGRWLLGSARGASAWSWWWEKEAGRESGFQEGGLDQVPWAKSGQPSIFVKNTMDVSCTAAFTLQSWVFAQVVTVFL